jgi:D-alanyl-D-alanine carboxypeptidase (penicillin-binding protein 5/6)
VSAEDMTLFTYQYIQKHPEALGELHNLKEYTYPEVRHGGNSALLFNIRQENKNYLLTNYEGADGVKTGFIDEIGYNLVGTAQRDGRRVLVCVMGIQAPNGREGSQKRADLAARLLDYAFLETQEVLVPNQVGKILLLGGQEEWAPLILNHPTYILFPKEEGGALRVSIHLKDDLKYLSAPILEMREVGTASFSFKGKILREVPIYVEPQEGAGFFKWLKDYFKMIFASLWGTQE